jgi:hypothetical protein
MYESGKTTTLWNYLLLAGQRRTSGTVYKGALRLSSGCQYATGKL